MTNDMLHDIRENLEGLKRINQYYERLKVEKILTEKRVDRRRRPWRMMLWALLTFYLIGSIMAVTFF